ncbi:MAG: two component transcriptional regulator, winged helix family [Acidobacteria bacterium]|jgi:DNA-binding response OmpR family regulator|nr:two component transcriptional regulator, winged helix family [Acidobacteriota bacterium]
MTRILIVEDDANIALGLQYDLNLEGYAVEVAADGDRACRRAREAPFDLIVLDIMLPGKDGFAVCRELRRAGLKTPILILTAKTAEAEKVLGLELGADDYVTKPFSPLELRARIKALLRRGAPEPQDICAFDDIEVDFDRCEVRRSGEHVDLTPTEFKLLATLIRRKGHLFTRDQLLDAVWGVGNYPTDRVVDNHMMNLRRKIERKPDAPRHLISARGLGYRFED